MHDKIKRENLLYLIDALSDNVITMEQFRALGNIKDFEKVKAIINILKIEDLENKDMVFEKLITKDPWLFNISSYEYYRCLISMSGNNMSSYEKVFEDFPIYKTDIKRQKHLLDTENVTRQYLSFLANDLIWNDEELVNMLGEIPHNVYMNFMSFEYNLFSNSRIVCNFIKYEGNINYLKTMLKHDDRNKFNHMFSYMEIESIAKTPLWTSYLIKYYNSIVESEKRSYADVFQYFEKYNVMDSFNKILNAIDTKEVSDDEKITLFTKFFTNIRLLNESDIVNEETNKAFNDEYFDALVNNSVKYELDEYELFKRIIEYARDRKIELEKIYELKNNIKNLPSYIQDTVISMLEYGIILNNSEILEVAKLSRRSDREIFLLKKMLDEENFEYIEKNKNYYGETFSPSFINYLNDPTLTKEDMMRVKDVLLTATSKFNKEQQNFYIDTTSIVPEIEIPNLDVPTLEVNVDEKNNESKSLIKKVLSKIKFTK